MEIKVARATERKSRPLESELGFGKYMSEHMFIVDYKRDQGWINPRVTPYAPLILDPAAMVLHYNQEVFEGLKAYTQVDGKIALFRPDQNIERLNKSASRLYMPQINPELFQDGLNTLIDVDNEWIPKTRGTSLYLRPTMIATEAALGLRPSDEYKFYIIACPVGAYYAEGFKPTKIYVSDKYVRAVQGGSGEAKTSGNYSPTFLQTMEAINKGYTQVLWLDAIEHKYVEEVGTSNIFFVKNNRLITPPLKGTILPGITRNSVLTIARRWGIEVEERLISIHEVLDGCKDGSISEVFASGTAAVISPVGTFGYKGEDVVVAGGKTGPLAQKMYDEITGIQYGEKEDVFNWMLPVETGLNQYKSLNTTIENQDCLSQ